MEKIETWYLATTLHAELDRFENFDKERKQTEFVDRKFTYDVIGHVVWQPYCFFFKKGKIFFSRTD